MPPFSATPSSSLNWAPSLFVIRTYGPGELAHFHLPPQHEATNKFIWAIPAATVSATCDRSSVPPASLPKVEIVSLGLLHGVDSLNCPVAVNVLTRVSSREVRDGGVFGPGSDEVPPRSGGGGGY